MFTNKRVNGVTSKKKRFRNILIDFIDINRHRKAFIQLSNNITFRSLFPYEPVELIRLMKLKKLTVKKLIFGNSLASFTSVSLASILKNS